jgi:UDP-galactopyranose mutase
LVHKYGPHIFHTNSERIFEYLSRFTEWRPYEHRVLSYLDGSLYEFPINQNTINKLYNLNLDEQGTEEFFNSVIEKRDPVRTSEDVCMISVGPDLFEKFFKNYTIKQWGLNPSQLSASVAARIPTRTNTDDRYFTDTYQQMPLNGYTAMFTRMLDHPNIDIRLNTDFFEIRDSLSTDYIVYTGQIDRYYDFRFGKLPYRSINFIHEHIADIEYFQQVGTVNYPNEKDYTRITEFKHLTGQSCKGTSIVKEYPCSSGEPYYPIPRPENAELFKRYQSLAMEDSNVFFVGRLAQYRYYNMDQAVAAALSLSKKILGKS